DLLADAPLDALDVRDEEIVTDELHPVAQLGRERLPSRPIVLGEAVLDRDERIAVRPAPIERDHAGGVEGSLLSRQRVLPAREELGRRRVKRERDVSAGVVSGLLDRGEDELDGLLVAFEARRRAAALVPHA